MIDPIERYKYPEEWIERILPEILDRNELSDKISSGFYILCPDGSFLRRGITTGTTASAAVRALSERSESVLVETPVGINVDLKVRLKEEGNIAISKKFSGDHSFDITRGMEIVAKKVDNRDKKIILGEGVRSVSRSAMDQMMKNMGDITVEIEMPEGNERGRKMGRDGISILGTTGFVEPWCDKLVYMKRELSKNYRKVAITTGRKGWRWAYDNTNFQPLVFGIHIDEGLKSCEGEVSLIGMPSLIGRWADIDIKDKKRGEEREDAVKEIYEKASKIAKDLVYVSLIFKEGVVSYG